MSEPRGRSPLEELLDYAVESAERNATFRDKAIADTPWSSSRYGREGERQAYEDMARKIREKMDV